MRHMKEYKVGDKKQNMGSKVDNRKLSDIEKFQQKPEKSKRGFYGAVSDYHKEQIGIK